MTIKAVTASFVIDFCVFHSGGLTYDPAGWH